MAFGGAGPLPAQAVVSVIGDRTEVETDVMQTRYVLGIRGFRFTCRKRLVI